MMLSAHPVIEMLTNPLAKELEKLFAEPEMKAKLDAAVRKAAEEQLDTMATEQVKRFIQEQRYRFNDNPAVKEAVEKAVERVLSKPETAAAMEAVALDALTSSHKLEQAVHYQFGALFAKMAEGAVKRASNKLERAKATKAKKSAPRKR